MMFLYPAYCRSVSSTGLLTLISARRQPRIQINGAGCKSGNLVTRHVHGSSSSENKQSLLVKYGQVFLVFHMTVSTCSIATLTVLLSRGFDAGSIITLVDSFVNVDSILSTSGYSRDTLFSSKGGIATSFALACVLNKLVLPIRLAVDAAMVPIIADRLKSRDKKL